MNERGSALMETTATLAFCASTLAAGLGISYATFAKFWLNRAAYEASICLSTSAPSFQCERELRRSTHEALPVGVLEQVVLTRSQQEVQTRFQWHLSRDFFLKIENSQSLPLLGPPKKTVSL